MLLSTVQFNLIANLIQLPILVGSWIAWSGRCQWKLQLTRWHVSINNGMSGGSELVFSEVHLHKTDCLSIRKTLICLLGGLMHQRGSVIFDWMPCITQMTTRLSPRICRPVMTSAKSTILPRMLCAQHGATNGGHLRYGVWYESYQ